MYANPTQATSLTQKTVRLAHYFDKNNDENQLYAAPLSRDGDSNNTKLKTSLISVSFKHKCITRRGLNGPWLQPQVRFGCSETYKSVTFLTSGIPEPQAYGANTFTRQTARKAKDRAQ